MKRQTFSAFSLLVISALFAPLLPLQANELQGELRHLRENHPLLRASEFALEAAEERRKASYSEYFPKITVTADKGDEKITTKSLVAEPEPTDYERKRWGISIEQNLYNGGKTRAGVSVAELDKEIKDVERRSVSQDVTLEALIAYLQVLRNRLLIGLAEANEAITLTQLEMEQKRVQRGSGIAVDEMQASTRLQIVRERRVFYEQGMRDALAAYEQVFGREPDLTRIQDLDNFVSALPLELQQAIETGLNSNPKLLLTNLQAERAQKTISVERASYYPSVDLVASQNRDTKVGGILGKDEDSIILKFSWNFMTGLETYRRTQAASFDYFESQEREKNTARRTTESIRLSWNQYQKGLERLKLLEEAARTSKKVMEGRKKLRDAGKETVLAVLDAEVEYFGVLANMVNAMADARLGSYRLLHALGAIDLRRFDLEGSSFELPVRPVEKVIDQLIGQGYFGPSLTAEPIRTTEAAPSEPTEGDRRAQAMVDAASATSSVASNAQEQNLLNFQNPEPTIVVQPEINEKPLESMSAAVEESSPPVMEEAVSNEVQAVGVEVPELPDQRESIATTVLSWATSWSNRAFDEYAGFYSNSFLTKDFRGRQIWLEYRKPRIIYKPSISVEVADMRVTPLNDRQVEVEFTQFYEGGQLKVRSRKKLLLGLEHNGWKILWEGNASDTMLGVETGTENNQKRPSDPPVRLPPMSDSLVPPMEVAQKEPQRINENDGSSLDQTAEQVALVQEQETTKFETAVSEDPVVEEAVAENREASSIDKELIAKFLEDWANRWSSKDFEAYADLYGEEFSNPKFSRLEDWLAYRKPRILGKQFIEVSIQLLEIKALEEGRVETRVIQNYAGNQLKVRSLKRLILDVSGGTPKIIWEGNA